MTMSKMELIFLNNQDITNVLSDLLPFYSRIKKAINGFQGNGEKYQGNEFAV